MFHPRRFALDQEVVPDVSGSVLEAPAGRRGPVRAGADGHLQFADGTRARFFGVNLVDDAGFPDHAEAERLAARIARSGFNLVRFTHMDAPWARRGLLSADGLDRLSYLLWHLKKRGVYAFLTLQSARSYSAADGVQDAAALAYGASLVGHFDRRLIELQKQQARRLLTYKSPYSGVALGADPQLALIEITNEDTLLAEERYAERVPPSYLAQLQRLARALEPAADVGARPFSVPTRRALVRLEQAYFAELRGHLRSLGVRAPVAGTNWFAPVGPAQLADVTMDFISRQSYWDHPQGGWSWKDRFHGRSMLRDPVESIIAHLAPMRLRGKPYVVMEWGMCWPNDFIAEGPLVAAAYAAMQDWDALLWFSMGGADFSDSLLGAGRNEVFDVSSKPHLLAQFPAAALLFHRRDVPVAQAERASQVSAAAALSGEDLSLRFDAHDALERRLYLDLPAPRDDAPAPWRARAPLRSEGLVWSAPEGLFTIETPRLVAVVGACGARERHLLSGVTLRLPVPFCALSVASLDGEPLARARRILVSVSGKAENSGAVYDAQRRLIDAGRGPIRMQLLRGELQLEGGFRVTPIAEDGSRLPAVQAPGPRARVPLGAPPALWYELTRL